MVLTLVLKPKQNSDFNFFITIRKSLIMVLLRFNLTVFTT